LSTKLTPEGNGPVSIRVGDGRPVVVTMKLPGWPASKVVLAPLVMAGAWTLDSVRVSLVWRTDSFCSEPTARQLVDPAHETPPSEL
jgi:hypothetical protein